MLTGTDLCPASCHVRLSIEVAFGSRFGMEQLLVRVSLILASVWKIEFKILVCKVMTVVILDQDQT